VSQSAWEGEHVEDDFQKLKESIISGDAVAEHTLIDSKLGRPVAGPPYGGSRVVHLSPPRCHNDNVSPCKQPSSAYPVAWGVNVARVVSSNDGGTYVPHALHTDRPPKLPRAASGGQALHGDRDGARPHVRREHGAGAHNRHVHA